MPISSFFFALFNIKMVDTAKISDFVADFCLICLVEEKRFFGLAK